MGVRIDERVLRVLLSESQVHSFDGARRGLSLITSVLRVAAGSCRVRVVTDDLADTLVVGVLAEFHHITGQCASLIAENVLDLAQLLIDIRSLRVHLKSLLIIHIRVPAHECALPELDDFERHNQRDGHKVGENQDPCARLLDEQKAPGRCPFVLFIDPQAHSCLVICGGPRRSDDGANYRAEDLHAEDEPDLLVRDVLDVTDLVDGTGRVHLDLRIVAGVDDNADDMLRIAQ